MKIYMSIDMEGISGVATSYQVCGPNGSLPEVRKLATGDVNAAIAGAKAAGATTIWVNENHSGKDLILEDVNPIAEVVIGKPIPLQTLDGLDESFDAVFMIGMHARAGTTNAVLDHSWSVKCIQNMRVNGTLIGELGLNALLAAHFGVPVILVTGDQAIALEAQELLGDVECAIVKHGRSRYAARCPHPSVSHRIIQEAAEKAVREIKRFKPLRMEKPMRMEIEYANTAFADSALWIPTVERVDPRTVGFTVPDFLVGFKTFLVAAALPMMFVDPVF